MNRYTSDKADSAKQVIKEMGLGKLLLKVNNSKLPLKNPMLVTSKVDKWNHGRGIHSVRKVAEKYGGNLILHDNGEEFEAILLLTDIEKLE